LRRYIYGEDPASQNDFFGIVIYGCIQLGLKVDMPGNHIGSQFNDAPEINYAMGNF